MEKVCKECGEIKSINDFGIDKYRKDGHNHICKQCRRIKSKIHSCICGYCNQSFKSYKKDAMFCSIECRTKSREKRIEVNCNNCGIKVIIKPHNVKRSKTHFCSDQCRFDYLRINAKFGKENILYDREEYACDNCGIKFDIIKSRLKKGKYHYCSKECKNEHRSITYKGEDHHAYNRVKIKCMYCGREISRIPSQIEANVNHYCSKECSRKHHGILYRGEKHHNYNPHLSEEHRIAYRIIPNYYIFSKYVFERDNYTCQCCGDNKGGNLNAHHLDGYDWCKEKRTDIDNGVTLCESCHKEFHKIYGYGKNTKEQFKEWINRKI